MAKQKEHKKELIYWISLELFLNHLPDGTKAQNLSIPRWGVKKHVRYYIFSREIHLQNSVFFVKELSLQHYLISLKDTCLKQFATSNTDTSCHLLRTKFNLVVTVCIFVSMFIISFHIIRFRWLEILKQFRNGRKMLLKQKSYHYKNIEKLTFIHYKWLIKLVLKKYVLPFINFDFLPF